MVLALHGVSVRHPAGGASPVLDRLDLRIAAGEQVALIGPSGAGKTSLLYTLAGAHQPAAGELHLLGENPWRLSSRARHRLRRRLFLAPQTPPLPPRQRVVTAVLAGRLPQWPLWQALLSLAAPRQVELAFDALARLGLEHKLYARVDRLSGGERQRCGLARLLVSQAQLLLVDEPLSALDPALALQALQVLQQEAQARQAALVCSLHQVELARRHFPRILGVRAGRIQFDARREDVSDAMVASLYRSSTVAQAGQAAEAQAAGIELAVAEDAFPDRLPPGRCF